MKASSCFISTPVLPFLAILLLQAFPTPEISLDPNAGWVPFEQHLGTYILFEVEVGDQTTIALLDSGASLTTFDAAFARSIKLPVQFKGKAIGIGGEQEMQVCGPVALEFGPIRIKNLTIAALDLSAIQAGLGKKVDVILGREIFKALAVEIDYPHRRIRFHGADSKSIDTPFEFTKLVLEGSLLHVECEIENGPKVLAALDTGAGGVIHVFAPYVKKHKMLKGRKLSTAMASGIGGDLLIPQATLSHIKLCGQTFTQLPASLHDIAMGAFDNTKGSANLGGGLFREFHVLIDLPKNRFGIVPRKEPVAFLRNRSGLQFKTVDDAFQVRYVAPNSPAAKENWMVGDRIVKINGKLVNSTVDSWKWSSEAAGTKVVLTLASGVERVLVLADYF